MSQVRANGVNPPNIAETILNEKAVPLALTLTGKILTIIDGIDP